MSQRKDIHFERSERKVLLRIIDLVVVLLGIVITRHFFDFNYFTDDSFYYHIFLLFIYISFFGTVFDMYHLPTSIDKAQTFKSTILTATTTTVVYLLTPLLTPSLPNRMGMVYLFLAIFIPLLIWRFVYIASLTSERFVKKSLIICKGSKLKEFVHSLEKDNLYYKIVAYFNTDNTIADDSELDIEQIQNLKDIENYVHKNNINEIVIGTEANVNSIYTELLRLMEAGVAVKDYVHTYENSFYKIPVDLIEKDFYKYFPFSRNNHNKLYLSLVRIGEILFALVGLFFVALGIPFLLIANALGNKGPLFYKQERIGKNGEIFKIVKFRSMVKDAEKNGAVFATKNDMRITPFGKFLRKSRIDELPQLINVLKGEMSVIGPRPERAVFVEQITTKMPLYTARHAVKPGLTGWAQINYKYGESLEDSIEKLKYDLYYIKHRSPFLDANVIIKTIGTVLFYRGQ